MFTLSLCATRALGVSVPHGRACAGALSARAARVAIAMAAAGRRLIIGLPFRRSGGPTDGGWRGRPDLRCHRTQSRMAHFAHFLPIGNSRNAGPVRAGWPRAVSGVGTFASAARPPVGKERGRRRPAPASPGHDWVSLGGPSDDVTARGDESRWRVPRRGRPPPPAYAPSVIGDDHAGIPQAIAKRAGTTIAGAKAPVPQRSSGSSPS